VSDIRLVTTCGQASLVDGDDRERVREITTRTRGCQGRINEPLTTRVEGNWKQMKGKIKEKSGRLMTILQRLLESETS
jgi:hypothetical protein